MIDVCLHIRHYIPLPQIFELLLANAFPFLDLPTKVTMKTKMTFADETFRDQKNALVVKLNVHFQQLSVELKVQ